MRPNPILFCLLFALSSGVSNLSAAQHRSEYRIASFNVENLFRHRKNPVLTNAYKRDLKRGNIPKYLPSSHAEFYTKVQKLAHTIKQMRGPEVIALQEVENFKPDLIRPNEPHALKELTTQLKQRYGYDYQFVLTPGASDPRGISQAFLYRKDRVSISPLKANDPLITKEAKIYDRPANENASVKSLNKKAPTRLHKNFNVTNVFSRPVLAGKFIIHQDGTKNPTGKTKTIYFLNNHFKSRSDKFQLKRRSQARFNANLVKKLLGANPEANLIIAGDTNVNMREPKYQKHLRPLNDLTTNKGSNLLQNLTQTLSSNEATHYYKGRGVVLDQMWTTQKLSKQFKKIETIAVTQSDQRPSDHNPIVSTFQF